MKKFIIAAILGLATLPAIAQRAADAAVWGSDHSDLNHSGLFLNSTLGAWTGNGGLDTNFGWGEEIGYRWHIGGGFNWDIAKVGYNTDFSHLSDDMSLRIMSGFRYNTPVIFGNSGLYANFALGWQCLVKETDFSGLAYEVGAGCNITRLISLGIVWESNQTPDVYYGYDSITLRWGVVGVKLGLNF